MMTILLPVAQQPFLMFLEACKDETVQHIVDDVVANLPFYAAVPREEVCVSVTAVSTMLLQVLHNGSMEHFRSFLIARLFKRFEAGLTIDQALHLPALIRQNLSRVALQALAQRIEGAEEGLLLLGEACDHIANAITSIYHHHLETIIDEHTTELVRANARLQREAVERERLHQEIHTLNSHLEQRVDERTTQLAGEIVQHKRTAAALRESEKRYRTISELTSDYIYSLRVFSDGQFKMEWFTESFIRSLGYDLEELRSFGDAWMEMVIYFEDIPRFRAHIHHVMVGHTDVCEFRACGRDGSVRWLRSYAQPEYDPEQQRVVRVLGAQQDITRHKREEEALRASEARYRAIVEDQTELICRFLHDGTLTFVNDAYCRYLNLPREQVLGGQFMMLMPDEERETLQQHFAALSLHNPVFTFEHRICCPNGKPGWQQWTIRALFRNTHDEHSFLEFQGVGCDITERKWAEEQLRYHALHDALTGLPNRTLFLDRLGQAMKRASQRHYMGFAVLVVDLDNFKMISGSLGHLLGDEMLKQVAQRLQHCLRSGDTVARSGDDEFAILLEEIEHLNAATEVVERIRHTLHTPFHIGDHEIVTSATIGIAMNTKHSQKPEDMLRDADIAMHRAKMGGRACYLVFDTTMYTHAVTRLQRETELHRAIERQELRLFYQPIVALASGQVVGLEALVRWEHPRRGVISPIEFIPIAEETGLIIPIGQWVLREACRQMRRWHEQFADMPPMIIHVNLSPREFAQPDLKQQIAQSLHESGLPSCWLNLEITESVMMSDAETTITTLKSLRELGVRLSIDDFGTGYSSLRYLQRFPVQVVKIDRSFVDAIASDPGSTAIVEAIVMLSHVMGMKVVAEGVASLEDLAQLESMGCEYGQGYFFAPACSSTDIEAWLLLQGRASGMLQHLLPPETLLPVSSVNHISVEAQQRNGRR
jgi:diguanylate cyclase (GGDEF)-like protein/PAS domain S-box-containing protein